MPVTGQDATIEGLQNILTGEQCMTVYKAVKDEADNAANLAIQLFKGQKTSVPDNIKDPESGAYVPFVSLTPRSITIENINDVVVTDKYIAQDALCKDKFLQLCKDNGVGTFAKDKKDDDDNQ